MARKKPAASNLQYFEYQDSKSHKFWEIALEGDSHTVRFGKVGTDGQTRTKSLKDAAAAAADVEKLIKQKTGKGYELVKDARKSSPQKSSAATSAKTKKAAAKTPKKKSAGMTPSAKKGTKKKPVKKKAVADTGSSHEGPPKLYYLQPDVFQGKKWVGEALVVNCLDMEEEEWKRKFDELIQKDGIAGKPLPMIVERHGRSQDCFFKNVSKIFGLMGVTQSAWKKLSKQIGDEVISVPVIVTREIFPAEFRCPKLKSKDQFKCVLFAPKKEIPFRHGQDMNWNREKLVFEKVGYGNQKSFPDVPMIDPQEIGESLLFRLGGRYVIATQAFVDLVKQSDLTGFQFIPIEYQPRSTAKLPAPKTLLDPIGKFPSKLVKKGWSKELVDEWHRLWDWTTHGLNNLTWPAQGISKSDPVDKKLLDEFEQEHQLKLPSSLRAAFETIGGWVEINYGRLEQTDPLLEYEHLWKEHVGLFMFGGRNDLWDVRNLENYEFVRETLSYAFECPVEEVTAIPFLCAGNGDLITVDAETEEIRYWSHDGDAQLNCRLGSSFVDFLTRWSWLGVPAIDFLPGTLFYDKQGRCLYSQETDPIKNWHRWLQGHQFS